MSFNAIPNPAKIPPNIPLQPPPPGTKSSIAHPDLSRQHRFVAACASTLTVALIFVGLRLYTRAFLVRSFGWDDALCIVATALIIVFNAAELKLLPYGLGMLDWDVSLKTFLSSMIDGWILWNAVGSNLYLWCVCSFKLSILLLYLRVFGKTHKRSRMAVWALIVIVLLFTIISFFLHILLCDPPRKLFVFTVAGTCKFQWIEPLAKAGGFMQVITDFFIVLVPLSIVVRLNLPLTKKLAVFAIMATGLFVTAISATRVVFLYSHGTEPKTGLYVAGEYLDNFWAMVEVNVALICISAPALGQFFGTIQPYLSRVTSKITGSSRSGQDPSKTSGSAGSGSRKFPWSKKSSSAGTPNQHSADGITRGTSIAHAEHTLKDPSDLERGPPPKDIITNSSYPYGPRTHVSVGEKEAAHSHSSREYDA